MFYGKNFIARGGTGSWRTEAARPWTVVINTQHLRLKPPEYLNKHEAAIWSEVVNATDPQHALENDILGHRSNPSDMSAG